MLYTCEFDVWQGVFVEITNVVSKERLHVGCNEDGGEGVKVHRKTRTSL